jgi:hypothetical protein
MNSVGLGIQLLPFGKRRDGNRNIVRGEFLTVPTERPKRPQSVFDGIDAAETASDWAGHKSASSSKSLLGACGQSDLNVNTFLEGHHLNRFYLRNVIDDILCESETYREVLKIVRSSHHHGLR